jgi:hypothetical protein
MLTTKEKEILQVIKKRKEYEDHFFKKVTDPKWFDDLESEGYFKPEKAPSCEPATDPGYYTIPQWNVLSYFERVSSLLSVSDNEKYAVKLLDIIYSITIYHIEHERKLDNYRTWACFVRVLLNIANNVIVSYVKKNNINFGQDWIKEWISSKFDNIVPASDITTKLLPKFLTNNPDDMQIAEQIIDIITDIKDEFFKEDKVQRIGIFEKRKEAKTTVDSYWLLESFKKNGQKIGELCSPELIFKLADRLKIILCEEHNEHQVLIEFDNDTYRIECKRINDFSFNFSVEKLNQSEIDVLKPEEKYFGVLKVKGEVLCEFSGDNLQDLAPFKNFAKDKIVNNESTSFLKRYVELEKKLNNLYRGLYTDHSTIWLRSIASSPELTIKDAKEIITILLIDLILLKCKSDIKLGEVIAETFFGTKYQFPLFRRLALFAIGNAWNDSYKKLFWNFVDKNPDIFEDSNYEVELYKLLETNVASFDDSTEKQRLEKLISAGPKDLRYADDEKGKKEKYIAHWKQKWYLALSSDPKFLKLLEEQKKITGVKEVEPPSENSFIKTRWGSGESPLTKEAILEMPIPKFVKYLEDFKSKGIWEGPTAEGLGEILRIAVKENPDKFVNDFSYFNNANYRYVYNILHGLEDAWKEKRSFDWGKMFEFSERYISKADFLESGKKTQGEDWHPYHIWILSVLSDLIQDGSRDDSWAFSEDHFTAGDKILSIILSILKDQPKKEEATHKDFVTEALNTTYGRTIISLILFSLRKARVQNKKESATKVRWDQSQYESLLKDGVIEAYTHFGQYMPNLAYLNRPWVEEKVKEFEDLQTSDLKWQAFMEGYLFCHKLYQDLYRLMLAHYIKGIESDFKGDRTENRLVQHITIGYLRGTELLEGKESLFKKILNKWDVKHHKEIASFFWSESRRIVEEKEKKTLEQEDIDIKERIMQFWAWTYENRIIIQGKFKQYYGEFQSDLSRLTILLDEINSGYAEWLLHLAPYVAIGFDATLFIEYLNRFTDPESCRYLGKIVLEMLKTGTPIYHEEHIVSIVEKIYRFGDSGEAEKICNIYGSRGSEILRKTYEENKLKTKK